MNAALRCAALRCAALRCAALMLVLSTGSVAAWGSTFIRLTIAKQAAIADAIVVGTVHSIDTVSLPEGDAVSLVRLDVSQVLRGSVPSGKLTLGLPGAYVGGVWVAIEGLPSVAVGDELLVFGDSVNATDVQVVSGPMSVFRKMASTSGTEIAADFAGNPVIDPGCTGWRQIARPADQAPDPGVEEGSDPSGTVGVVPMDREFVADPSSLGMPWGDFIDALEVCINAQTASQGSQVSVGGGW